MLFITTFTTSILSSNTGGPIVGIVVGVRDGEAALIVVSGGVASLDVVGVGEVASVVK